MLIIPCLLDTNNQRPVKGTTVGALIAAGGRRALWNQRPPLTVDTVIIHHISALEETPADPFDDAAILAVFCSKVVSCHYLVKRNGEVLNLVPDSQRAWHAGGSIMPAPDLRRNVNDFSIGIELVATPESGYTAEQYEAAAELFAAVGEGLGWKPFCLGHQEIAGAEAVRLGLRRDVKHDPGPRFDWPRFRRLAGIG